ncbi:antitoxin VbhA family protein [Sutcliffiella cohnii]|uniref:antitoxin VbhA family protein n=1 Tax=Sutcliffiella cohnii TaxID=33932 RepID=UPI002E20DE3E|nr:antitoxin VbhA family protein [Sutcliffiella cohnii]
MSEKWEKAIKYAKATNAIEGLYVTPEEEVLILSNLEGHITDEEFLKIVKDMTKS